MRRTHTIEFTAAPEDRNQVRRRVLLIVLAVILLGAASFFIILAYNDFDFARFLGARDGEETSVSETPSGAAQVTPAAPFSDENAVNVLFFCAEGGKDLDFCELVSFSEKENVIRVKPIALDGVYSWNGGEYTLKRLFADFSASAVAAAFQDRDIRVARYVNMTESAFKQILQTLGDVEVEVPREITYSEDGITYSQKAGPQSMRPDVLLKYMKFAFSGDEKFRAEGEAFAAVFRTHFTAENVNRGEEFFSSLIDRTSTDLSVFDYAAYKDDVLRFLQNGPRIDVIS